MINPMELSGKRIIVTGASSGIGRETALHVARLGAEVVCVARNQERLQQTIEVMEGSGHSQYSFDLARVQEIAAFSEQIIAEHGKIDGLVYCAGIGNTYPFKMTDYEKILGVLNVNLFGFLEMVRVLSAKKNRNANASFVGVSSIASIRGEKGLTAYGTSKGAMDSAVRAMARELGSAGIRVNTVLPGWIKTELVDNTIAAYGDEKYNRETATVQVLGLGEPLDVANAIAFLLCDASKFITGTHMIVDGGYMA